LALVVLCIGIRSRVELLGNLVVHCHPDELLKRRQPEEPDVGRLHRLVVFRHVSLWERYFNLDAPPHLTFGDNLYPKSSGFYELRRVGYLNLGVLKLERPPRFG